MASSLLGTPRFTRDADICVEPFANREPEFAACFGVDDYLSLPAMKSANSRRGSFNIIHISTGFKLDFFVRKDRPLDLSAMSRAVSTAIPAVPGLTVRVLTAKDLVLYKLECYRLGNQVSNQQWTDVLGILRTQAATLDRDYLRQFAGGLQLLDLLDAALAESAV